jgi:rod shape determining protein RodA
MATITSPLARRRDSSETSVLHHIDPFLIGIPLAIAALGLLMIDVSSRSQVSRMGLSRYYFVERQAIALFIGVAAMVVVMAIDYRRIRDMWVLLYLAMLPVLVAVLVLGSSRKGAQAWFQVGPFQFQPSEIAKIVLIIAVAGYCHQHRGDLDAWRLAVVVALAGVMLALVYAQNDLGTTLVMLVCASAIVVVAGLKPVHVGVLLLLGVTLVGAAIVTGKIEAHQLDRLTNFVDQDTEGIAVPEQTSTQLTLRASKSAIASGGLTGTGLFNGIQTKNGFVPEQHTDFIFTAVGEELGFAGGATLIALYGLLAWRIWRIALLSSDFFGTLVAIGVLAMFVVQVFENIGMSMGIMPITGIPLPFMSYGGSALIASFIAVGLVHNIHMRRFS